jgi:hypothetical protein
VRAAKASINDFKYRLTTAKANLAFAQRDVDSAKRDYDYAKSAYGSIDLTAELAKADQDIANA